MVSQISQMMRLSDASGPVLIIFLAASQAHAQPAPAASPTTFEATSVRVATSGANGANGGCHGIDSVYRPAKRAGAPPLGRCVIRDARLSHLIGIAYGVSMLNLKTGPDWIQRGDLRFNIEAKAENPAAATEKQLLTMLQNLLVERFQLKFHYESRETPGFALTVAKGGPKLEVSKSDEPRLLFKGPSGEATLKPVAGQPMSITARKCSMSMLINLLFGIGGHGPGIDKTGLTGEYDFNLSWDEDLGPALPTALREQLGVHLEAEKVPVSTLIVDSAQKPDAN
jgi:uncharacterized protein (TIGR03435 family)